MLASARVRPTDVFALSLFPIHSFPLSRPDGPQDRRRHGTRMASSSGSGGGAGSGGGGGAAPKKPLKISFSSRVIKEKVIDDLSSPWGGSGGQRVLATEDAIDDSLIEKLYQFLYRVARIDQRGYFQCPVDTRAFSDYLSKIPCKCFCSRCYVAGKIHPRRSSKCVFLHVLSLLFNVRCLVQSLLTISVHLLI